MNAHQEVEKLAERIRENINLLSPEAVKIENALDQILVLAKGYMQPPEQYSWDGVELTPLERRLAARLFQRPGERVSHDQLYDALYFDKAQEPESRTVDVFLSRLRNKFRGTKYQISCRRGNQGGICGMITEAA